jgi:preprotein translocase subunit SecA
MEYLRDSVSLRAFGQKEPIVEYKKEGNRIFKDFFKNLNSNFSKLLRGLKLEERKPASVQIQISAQRPGRNDLCPCGSGKKYKRCCWPKYGY